MLEIRENEGEMYCGDIWTLYARCKMARTQDI
jgi:hypothetical protein